MLKWSCRWVPFSSLSTVGDVAFVDVLEGQDGKSKGIAWVISLATTENECFCGLILSKYYELCHDPVCYLNMYI